MEEWKDIKGYEGLYQISNLGRVKNIKTNYIRKSIITKLGYYQVKLLNKMYLIHRLVAQAFIDNPNNYPEINHSDGNKANNKIENLIWCTRSQNVKHSFDNGLKISVKGIFNGGGGKLTENQVLEIRAKYKPKVYHTYILAKEYGVSQHLIMLIVHNKIWKHI